MPVGVAVQSSICTYMRNVHEGASERACSFSWRRLSEKHQAIYTEPAAAASSTQRLVFHLQSGEKGSA